MSTVQEIEAPVRKLSRDDLSAFHTWFSEFDAETWDRHLESDVRAGRLDALAEEAQRDLREEHYKDVKHLRGEEQRGHQRNPRWPSGRS